jgi:predicted nucleic acid-binding protein
VNGFLYDTNCLVALAKTSQQHYAATSTDYARRRSVGQALIIAMHSVEEAYSVLTRSPPPLRFRPDEAWTLIEDWAGQAQLVDLIPEERLKMVRAGAGLGITGGQIHDFIIAACARKAGVQTLVTWNLRHFARWAGPDLEVVNPLGERAQA